MYKSKSSQTLQACVDLGFLYRVGFVKTHKRKGKIFVDFSIGKECEILSLFDAVSQSDKYHASPGLAQTANRLLS